MKCLMDTHVLLWFLMESNSLSSKAKELISNPKVDVYVSTVSFWEISIKSALGKLELRDIEPDDLEDILFDAGIGIIGLNERESSSVGRLPIREKHKDPFDRMLIWQAITRNMTLISKDAAIHQYQENGLRVVW
jgi:PIN domain nuclease of toxin-antitoxin system